MKDWLKITFGIMLFTAIVCADYQADKRHSQIRSEIQQYRAEVEQLRVSIDANDAIVNRWLMEGDNK